MSNILRLSANTKTYRAMSNDDIMRRAPSVFAQNASEKTSDRFLFIPTIQAVDAIRAQGFSVVQAMQTNSRTIDGKMSAKHMLRFRRNDQIGTLDVGGLASEIVLFNAHDGTSVYHLSLGIFRQACANGLIVCDSLLASEKVKHIGYDDGKIIDATYRVIDQAPKALESVKAMQSVELTRDEQLAFADAAKGLRWEQGDNAPDASKLLTVRRYDDQKNDLWTTFNRVQENIIKGGLRTISRDERGLVRRNSTREVASVTENKRLNQALWELAESMRKLKGAA